MSITKRLFTIITLLSLSIIGLSIFSITSLDDFQKRFEYVQDNTFPSIKNLDDSITECNTILLLLYKYQSITDGPQLDSAENSVNEHINKMKGLADDYMKNDISSNLDKKMTEDAYKNIATAQSALPDFFSALRSQNGAVSLPALNGDNGIGASVRNLVKGYQAQIQLNFEIGNDLRKQNAKVFTVTFWNLLIFSVLTILLIGSYAFKTILNIRNSLNNIKNLMTEVSGSLDLTLFADATKRDEIGQTASAFNSLMAKVSSVLSSVTNSAQSVSSASSQIATGNEDLSARTEEQAASLEEMSVSMSNLNDTVKQSAENARQASTFASNANTLAEHGGHSVDEMVETMQSIKKSSEKISEITGLIEGIAFQTNILALNAAVEAARAGEQGRGFAVVASEVRSLAQRSSKAAKEIKDLIVLSAQLVENGFEKAVHVDGNMTKVKSAIHQVADIVGEMAAATLEQSQGIGEVHQAVDQMDSVTQQNAALVEQASAASQSLQEQADTLKRMVEAFKLQPENADSVIIKDRTRPLPPLIDSKKITPKLASEEKWLSF